MQILVCLNDQSPCPSDAMAWVDLFNGVGLDAETLSLIFSYGAAPIVFCYLLGYGLALAKSIIRKI